MRREKDLQLKIADITQDVPIASWTQVLEFPYYPSSRLNPEVETTVSILFFFFNLKQVNLYKKELSTRQSTYTPNLQNHQA